MDLGSILGPRGVSPEMLFGCPEGSCGYLGASGSGLLGPAGALQAHYAHAQDRESRFKLQNCSKTVKLLEQSANHCCFIEPDGLTRT